MMYNRDRDAMWMEVADNAIIEERRAKARAKWDCVIMTSVEDIGVVEYDGDLMRMIANIYVPHTGKWYTADRLMTSAEMLRVTPEQVLARITTKGAYEPLLPKPPAAEPPPKPPGMAKRVAYRLLPAFGLTGGVALSRAFPGPGALIAIICLGLMIWAAVALYKWAKPKPKPPRTLPRPY